jgi:hypothetical protein
MRRKPLASWEHSCFPAYCMSWVCRSLQGYTLPDVFFPAIYLGTRELPLDPRLPSVLFFALQGLGLVAERLFTRLTGRPVGGWIGKVWILLALALPGAGLAESW